MPKAYKPIEEPARDKIVEDTRSADDKLRDTIVANLVVLTAEDYAEFEVIENIKLIVCPFYKGGENPMCRSCHQPNDTLHSCKDSYVSKINIRPMEIWSPEFDSLKVREKKVVDETAFRSLHCDTCAFSKTCPEYEAMSTCAIDWTPGTDVTKPSEVLEVLIHIQHGRLKRANSVELMDGGIPDQTLSNEMDRMTVLLNMKNEVSMDRFSVTMTGKAQTGDKPSALMSIFGGFANGGNKEVAPAEKTLELTEATDVSVIDITKAANVEFDETKIEPGKKKRIPTPVIEEKKSVKPTNKKKK